MRRAFAMLAGVALIALTTPAAAQAPALVSRPDRATVVIYRDQPVDTAELLARSADPYERLDQEGMALIVETRVIDLPAGEAVIRFEGVATGIVPQSAVLDGLPAQVVERNIDFDLLSPGSLLQRSVGETVSVVRTNPVTGEPVTRRAIVRSGPSGTVLEVDGQLEALSCSGLTQRIIFDRVPEGLGDQPVLSVRTRAPTAGRYTVTLAYLATGLQWSADYVARVNPDGRTLSLSGWLTLANFGGTAFRDAPVQVVAGTLNRDDDTVPVEPREVSRAPACWPQDTTTHGVMPPEISRVMYLTAEDYLGQGAVLDEIVVTGSRLRRDPANSPTPLIMAEQGELGDYKIYTLPGPTDVMARQTKQVRFMQRDNVRFTRIYRETIWADGAQEPRAPRLLLRTRNDARNGLGLALPGGGVALMETGAGRPLFTGQARFEDRAVGLPVELEFGTALDLTVSHAVEPREAGAPGRRRIAVTVTLQNDKPRPAQIEIVPGESRMRGFRIVESSARSLITDSGYPAWRVTVPAGAEQRLTYTVEYEN